MKRLVSISDQKEKAFAIISAAQCHGENTNFSANSNGYQVIQIRTASSLAHAVSIQMDLARENPKADLFSIMHLTKTEIAELERRSTTAEVMNA